MTDPHALCKLYTPGTCAQAVVDALPIRAGEWVHEPHAGGGSFLRALENADVRLTATDIAPDEGITFRGGRTPEQADFLTWSPGETSPDWIIGNPPYTSAEAHIRHALVVSGRSVVFVLRLAMLEGVGRAAGLWAETPLREVMVLAPRPSFTLNGRTDTKTAYAAFWWDKSWKNPPQVRWVRWSRRGGNHDANA